MLDHLLERAQVELIDDLLAHAGADDELRLPEDGEMPRHGGPGGVEVLGDLPRRPRPISQEPQDVPPGRIREGAKGGVHLLIV